MNKKTKIMILSVIALAIVTLSLTFAYWIITRTQTGQNFIGSACLDISISNEQNDIDLGDQYPISDEDGSNLTPYTFTVTNNCSSAIDYEIALEVLNTSTMSNGSVKAMIDTKTPKVLTGYKEAATKLSNASKSYRLALGTLGASGSATESATHELRLWITENAPTTEMNKTFASKISINVGQGIANKPTLAETILNNYGGEATIPSISSEPKEIITSTENLYISTSSSYYYGTSYTLDEATGIYTLGGTIVQAKSSECRNGTKTCGKYTLKNGNATSSSSALYEIADWKTSGNYVTGNTIQYTSDFGILYNTGLYKIHDDLGESYYFRGNPTNSYVKFGTYQEDDTDASATAGQDMYWRIIRINGDGSIRMIYDGTELVENGTDHTAIIGTVPYNSAFSTEVGYTYDNNGTETNSTIKDYVETWYSKHLETNYGKYIQNSVFCNDKEISFTEVWDAYNSYIYYAPYNRMRLGTPQLTCKEEYSYNLPIGLITADEALLAQVLPKASDRNNYLYNGYDYWTLTPDNVYVDAYGGIKIIYGGEFSTSGAGFGMGIYSLYSDGIGARPVINLKADVEFTGNGTIDSPYEIVMN